MTALRISHTERISHDAVQRASLPVLTQVMDVARSRVSEERLRAGLTPLGDYMVCITVEQWVETGNTP